MICTQNEEIESLQAIFCKSGEFTTRKETDGLHITVTFDFSSVVNNRITNHSFDDDPDCISFYLVPEYPLVQPLNIRIRCSYLPADIVLDIKQQIEEKAATLLGQSMLLDLCYLTQELLEKEIDALQTKVQKTDSYDSTFQLEESAAIINSSTSAVMLPDCAIQMKTANLDIINDKCVKTVFSQCQREDTNMLHEEEAFDKCGQNFTKVESHSKVVTAILQLDHMRSQQNYIKLIKKWTAELGLTGRLIFCGKHILILLQGMSKDVKEYIVRNRTTNVDVDARGRACKERMLTVLCEVSAETHIRLSEFCVLELPTMESLQEFLKTSAMENLYLGYISHLDCTSYNKKKIG